MATMMRCFGVVMMWWGAVAASSTGSQLALREQRPIQGRQVPRVAEMAGVASVTLVCRGGAGITVENRGPSRTNPALITLSLSFTRVEQPAGADGGALPPGTCSAVDRVLAPGESSRIQIDTDAGARIEQELRDSGRLWRFDTTRAAGYFNAASGAPLAGAAPPPPQQSAGRDRAELRGGTIIQGQARAAIRSDLLDMDDRAIIIVGGREVTAGDVKRDILQRLPPPSSTAQRVNAPPRSQPGTALIARPGEIIGGLRRAETVGVGREAIEAATAIDCNKGPLVGRMQGVVSPGETISIAGACFGSTPGSIEIIGQFSGPTAGAGPMRLDFVSWKDGEIVARTPPIQGPDQVVSLTVVRADGRRSGTKPSRFVATRERVDVPSHYWQPSPRYQWRGVFERSYDMFRDNFDGTRTRNSGTAPPSDFRLRINPACALETMEAIPRLGAVTGIQGWDNPGPPHEASVRIMWQPRATRTRSEYLVGYENIYVDEIDFELRATATCPVGIRP